MEESTQLRQEFNMQKMRLKHGIEHQRAQAASRPAKLSSSVSYMSALANTMPKHVVYLHER